MENGTSSSDDILHAFWQVAAEARERFGVVLHLLRVAGARRAYVAGDTAAVAPGEVPHILSQGRFAVAVYGWQRLSPDRQASLEEVARAFLRGQER